MSIASPPLCMFFNTKQGCRNGNQCKFIHSKPSQIGTCISTSAQRPIVASMERKNVSEVKINEFPKTSPQLIHHQPLPVESLWENSCDVVSSNDSGPHYVDIVKNNLAYDESQNTSHLMEDHYNNYKNNKIQEICTFFLAGHCKFGDRCRYLHTYEEEVSDNMVDAASISIPSNNKENDPIECGICIEPPVGSLYGILSHCSCKFCLSCIRNWRSEGITVTKDQKQVRICPLCRTVSYYVVPSKHFLFKEPEKNALLAAYKKSIEKKPCKYYHQDGHCPFGSSCFYMHEIDGSKGTEKTHRNAGLQTIANIIDIDSLIRNRRNNSHNNSDNNLQQHEQNDIPNEDEDAVFEEFLALTEGMQNLSYEDNPV